MNPFVIISALFALASAQFPPEFPGVPGVTPPPWQGPLADHINGIPPQDTPEVAASKQQLQRAYQEVLAVLPVLPPEIRYQPGQIVVPVAQNVQNQQNVHQSGFVPVAVPQHVYTPQGYVQPQTQPAFVPEQPQPQFTQYAEEIPRSPLGEVPEVALARRAHLAAFQAAQSSLPQLVETPRVGQSTQHIQPVVPVPQYVQNYNQAPQDTPEVQAAKAQHAAAVAALG